MASGDNMAEPAGRWGIPVAFYRDDAPPLPPRGDPHRVEFDLPAESDSVSRWMLLGVPFIALAVFLLHAFAAIIILQLLH